LSLIFFGGCGAKNEISLPRTTQCDIADLKQIPQDVLYFAAKADLNSSVASSSYEKGYFSVWHNNTLYSPVLKTWQFKLYMNSDGFGENLQPLEAWHLDKITSESNFEDFGKVNKKAVSATHLDLRVFPTNRPYFKNPLLAGEGYPFDYFQNSTVFIGEPIVVSHYSRDGGWAYVFSSYASGWIRVNELIFVDDDQALKLEESKRVFVIKDAKSLFFENGAFAFESKIGSSFAFVGDDGKNYGVLAPHHGKMQVLLIPKSISSVGYLDFSKIGSVARDISRTNYGWGGYAEQRDCSSTLRDIFAPFGVWLPRNSYEQSMVGQIYDLKKMSDLEKVETIKKYAIPFKTLLYKAGHIMLYVGEHNGDIVIFHNVWGIKTIDAKGQEGRVVIGGVVLSSLQLGKELPEYNSDKEILKNLTSMNTLLF
jgi:hypothetical protein